MNFLTRTSRLHWIARRSITSPRKIRVCLLKIGFVKVKKKKKDLRAAVLTQPVTSLAWLCRLVTRVPPNSCSIRPSTVLAALDCGSADVGKSLCCCCMVVSVMMTESTKAKKHSLWFLLAETKICLKMRFCFINKCAVHWLPRLHKPKQSNPSEQPTNTNKRNQQNKQATISF